MAWRIRRTSMKSQHHSEGKNDVKFEYGRPVGSRYGIISLSSYELFVWLVRPMVRKQLYDICIEGRSSQGSGAQWNRKPG